MSDICKCGHDREAHYQYINNGVETTRCRQCDPWVKTGHKGGIFEVIEGSDFYWRDKAADHPFEVSVSSQN